MSEGIRGICYRSRDRYHHWKQVDKLTKWLKDNTNQIYYRCILCQVNKFKLTKYVEKDGVVRAVCTEIFPSGQIVDEMELDKPLSEQEEYKVK